jgi:hypothetical protein
MDVQLLVEVKPQLDRVLPGSIEEVDAEFLSAALSTYAPGTEVRAFEIVDVIHGLTTILRLKLDLNEAGRKAGLGPTIMLKAGFEPHSQQFASSYAMEITAHRDVWPGLGLRTPIYYFADADLERKRTVILMEDLKARGVTFCSNKQPQKYHQVARRLTALAEAHAKTWNSADIRPGGKYDGIVLQNGAAILLKKHTNFGSFTPDGWRAWIEQPRGATSSARFLDLDWARDATAYMARISPEISNAIIHGDCHLGNLYIDVDGEPGFYDSLPRREPPFFEVAYVINCSMDVLDRREADHMLVRHYAEEARRLGVDTSYEECLYYYKIFLMMGWMYFIVNSTDFQTEWFNTIHTARFHAAMLDHGTYELISSQMYGGFKG